MVWLFIALAILIPIHLNADDMQADNNALIALKNAITADYGNYTDTWRETDPVCDWSHITCDKNNRVTRIDLGGSNLIGSLVDELGSLTELRTLNIYTTGFTGSIPPTLGRLTNLQELNLYDNFLEGHIPQELGSLENLDILQLQDNNLNGTVPDELSNRFPLMYLVNLTGNLGPGGIKSLHGHCTNVACNETQHS